MRAIAALLLFLAAAPSHSAPLISEIGPDIPPEGRSAFAEVFEGGVPFPFAAVLDRLRQLGEVETALIPLGRSLQRFSAHPDYFASPRLVVAVTADGAGPEAPHLAGRLYLGYQPAGETIEAISYNEAAGRFEFEEIVGYAADAPRRIEPATRAICAACHHGLGPIFARPLWSESNANPEIAARLAALGDEYHGAPVRQTVDALDAFDAATDAAARIPLAHRLWAEGCADAPCRAALLAAALAFRLSGARPDWSAANPDFDARASTLWPEGLATPGFDLLNRDPIPLLAHLPPAAIVETDGPMNPETPRAPTTLWTPGDNDFASAAREVGAMLTDGDLAAIAKRLGGRVSTLNLTCDTTRAARPQGGEEIRFACQNPDVSGHLADGAGRIDHLRVGDAPPLRNLAIQGRNLRQPGSDLPARLHDGRRVAAFRLDPPQLDIVDDFAPLAAALTDRAKAGDPAFGPGPFRRRALMTTLLEILEPRDG